jgi:hypothetical protein
MNDSSFDLHVDYRNNEMIFPAQFLRTGYSYKIQVDVNGTFIDFEPDEERNWRAIVNEDPENYNSKASKELLEAIANSLEQITK